MQKLTYFQVYYILNYYHIYLYFKQMKMLSQLTKEKSKSIRKLSQKKFREIERKFIIEGVKIVQEAMASDWITESVLVTKEFFSNPSNKDLFKMIEEKGVPVFQISANDLDAMTDTLTAQGIAAIVEEKITEHLNLRTLNSLNSIMVAVDRISDAGNLGTIIRICDWFKADALLIGQESVELFNPKVVRGTMGSVFHLPIYRNVDLVRWLSNAKTFGYKVYAATMDGSPLQSQNYQKKSIFVFGSESHGISDGIQRIADTNITIPRFGKAESLNVAVACGIVIANFKL
ncbi:MAG: RNA methyltransferase [Bacteroidota bacterium]|nr:RNA methyltransferase [Bacteroidota bacterium]